VVAVVLHELLPRLDAFVHRFLHAADREDGNLHLLEGLDPVVLEKDLRVRLAVIGRIQSCIFHGFGLDGDELLLHNGIQRDGEGLPEFRRFLIVTRPAGQEHDARENPLAVLLGRGCAEPVLFEHPGDGRLHLGAGGQDGPVFFEILHDNGGSPRRFLFRKGLTPHRPLCILEPAPEGFQVVRIPLGVHRRVDLALDLELPGNVHELVVHLCDLARAGCLFGVLPLLELLDHVLDIGFFQGKPALLVLPDEAVLHLLACSLMILQPLEKLQEGIILRQVRPEDHVHIGLKDEHLPLLEALALVFLALVRDGGQLVTHDARRIHLFPRRRVVEPVDEKLQVGTPRIAHHRRRGVRHHSVRRFRKGQRRNDRRERRPAGKEAFALVEVFSRRPEGDAPADDLGGKPAEAVPGKGLRVGGEFLHEVEGRKPRHGSAPGLRRLDELVDGDVDLLHAPGNGVLVDQGVQRNFQVIGVPTEPVGEGPLERGNAGLHGRVVDG
jgi:hypothetical protein